MIPELNLCSLQWDQLTGLFKPYSLEDILFYSFIYSVNSRPSASFSQKYLSTLDLENFLFVCFKEKNGLAFSESCEKGFFHAVGLKVADHIYASLNGLIWESVIE